MHLKNHIGARLLTDKDLPNDIVNNAFPGAIGDPLHRNYKKAFTMWQLLNSHEQKAYYVTKTVINLLDLLAIRKREDGEYDWTVFSEIEPGKRTFIFDENKVFRIRVWEDGVIHFILLYYEGKVSDVTGKLKYEHFWINTATNFKSDFTTPDIEMFMYKLLCFIYMSDNEEITVEPGRKYGTKKQGKVVNTIPFPITIINSRWNTTVKTDAFAVSGHFRLQKHGPQRKKTTMIWIEPFEKEGYTRKSGSTNKI